jgi:hypothetical protein
VRVYQFHHFGGESVCKNSEKTEIGRFTHKKRQGQALPSTPMDEPNIFGSKKETRAIQFGF